MSTDSFLNYRIDSFEHFELIFKKAIDLFEEYGIKVESSRIDKYEKDLSIIVKTFPFNSATKVELSEKLKSHSNTLYEVSQINFIYESLSKIKDQNLIKQLKKIIKGPVSYQEESIKTSSNEARNFQFELYILSALMNSGILEYKQIGNHDISFEYKNKIIIIECKRVQSTQQIRNRIKEAGKQIQKSNTLKLINGIVALDISKIINPNFDILVASNKESLGRLLTNIANNFANHNSKFWNNEFKYKKVTAIILRFSTVAYLSDQKLLNFCSHQDVRILPGRENSQNAQTIKEIINKLRN